MIDGYSTGARSVILNSCPKGIVVYISGIQRGNFSTALTQVSLKYFPIFFCCMRDRASMCFA